MIGSFGNFIGCFLMTHGRGKNSSAMKLHIEKDLMGMYIFNEKAA
jgi:Co/Zn/Cd efflux system component